MTQLVNYAQIKDMLAAIMSSQASHRSGRPSIPAPPKRLPPKSPFTLVKFNTPPVLSFNTQLSGSLLNMNAWPSLSIASGQSLNRPA